ncbi:hypothetical protein ACU610_07785 [Geodermatophilus sp. URMC 61]|uniref:hypothetical protein n=1 Tax=Geodermatophilus sp. URMC 61 TaxID=3423411 RepID=UPI00406D3995
MSHSSSDAAIEVIKVGRDGIRFRFGAELHIPEHPSWVPPRPPDEALPAQYDRFWVTATSPPPTRDGKPWEWGLMVADPGQDPPPAFDPTVDGEWQRHGITWVDGIPLLDTPPLDSVILDQALHVPFEWGREMTFEEKPDPLGFLSVPYKQPYEYDPTYVSVGVNYYGEYTLPWRTPLAPGAWVAVSFDRFRPPERKSADFITQVRDCNLFHSPSWRPAAG